jgi:23S rRNA (uracil1939-C5)-methyltransferase
LQLTIEKLIYGGDGLARLPADERGRGKAVFIPFVLENEMLEASLIEQKPGFARGIANAISSRSPHRIEPPCPYFVRCGGCHYQHSDYAHQLDVKAAILRENFRRIAKLELDIELKIHPSPEWNYRNRSRFAVQFEPEFGLCYHKFNSHELLPVEQCPISSPLINQALQSLWTLGRAGEWPKEIREVELLADAEDKTLLIETHCENELAAPDFEQWFGRCKDSIPALAGATAFAIRSEGSAATKLASTGQTDIRYETAGSAYRVSAGSFFQVNRHLIGELVSVVTEGRSGAMALDLYAGVGLFSSVLNRDFQRVIAVESSPISYADLLYNSAANVKAVQATTEQYLENAQGKVAADFVVVDPPRAGLSDAVLRSLSGMKARAITYVSCDPATAARDLRGLLGFGYKLQEAHLLDLFPQTFHIESVFHLVR